MRLLAGLGQFGPIKAPHRPATNDGDLHWMEGRSNGGRTEDSKTATMEDSAPGGRPIIPSSPPRPSAPFPRPTSPMREPAAYLAPKMASLAALATRNFTTRFAGIWICSPVAGLRPMRAARLTNTSLPNPGSVKVFLACLYAN